MVKRAYLNFILIDQARVRASMRPTTNHITGGMPALKATASQGRLGINQTSGSSQDSTAGL